MDRDLTKGSVIKSMLLFAVPLILGDLLQQCYNIADTLIVGRFLGRSAAWAARRRLLQGHTRKYIESGSPAGGGRKFTSAGQIKSGLSRLVF